MRRLAIWAGVAAMIGTAGCAGQPPGATRTAGAAIASSAKCCVGPYPPELGPPPLFVGPAFYMAPADIGPPLVYRPRALVRGYWFPAWRQGSW